MVARRKLFLLVRTWEFVGLVEDGTTLATGFFGVHAIKWEAWFGATFSVLRCSATSIRLLVPVHLRSVFPHVAQPCALVHPRAPTYLVHQCTSLASRLSHPPRREYSLHVVRLVWSRARFVAWSRLSRRIVHDEAIAMEEFDVKVAYLDGDEACCVDQVAPWCRGWMAYQHEVEKWEGEMERRLEPVQRT